MPLLSPGSKTDLACTGAKPREGPVLALQLSSNGREREVGQVPLGVERKQAWAPGRRGKGWGWQTLIPKPVSAWKESCTEVETKIEAKRQGRGPS